MLEMLQLIVLFFVIIDPMASFAVFLAASSAMTQRERKRTALIASIIAISLSALVLIFGSTLLTLFNTSLDEFKVAGGIILGILGVKMALGIPLKHIDEVEGDSGMALASIIGTPLITGPATILTIILTSVQYGKLKVSVALAIVLTATSTLLLLADKVRNFMGKDFVRIVSTILGMITLAWGVKFITEGLLAIF